MNTIVNEDLKYIFDSLSDKEKNSLSGNFLITGCGGFLGFYLVNFLVKYKDILGIENIICLDNFKIGYPKWLSDLGKNNQVILQEFNIISDKIETIENSKKADYIIHMASIASPVFYRKYPIETLDANVWGLRNLLDYYCNKKIKGFLFFSSSEIYGDPDPLNIPTKESFRGYVDCKGPRACYDEAKRFGETICYLYNQKYNLPISIVRPFNNYGPGMRLNDKRVPADFARSVFENKDIEILSDGTPTRTFCYIADAICGYLKVLINGQNAFDTFNIGMDRDEISIRNLANIYVSEAGLVMGYKGNVIFNKSSDKNYLTNNPNRRCPDITKARTILNFNPKISVNQGVKRFLTYITLCSEEELIW